MFEVTSATQILIAASEERVFRWITDGGRVRQWLSSMTENVNLTQPSGTAGTHFRQTHQHRGRNVSLQGEVTAFQRNKRLAVRVVGRGCVLSVDYRLEAADGATRLIHSADVRLTGLVRIVAPWFRRKLQRNVEQQAREDLTRLKQLCEAEQRAAA